MDNPVDHVVDLGLVNYVKHPTNPDYIVYRFADSNRAESFENYLKEQNIWFEKEIDNEKTREYILFGIHKHDFTKVSKINYKVEAEHKKPFIPFRGFRIFLIAFFGIVITLAIIGFCKQQDTISSHNNNNTTVNTNFNVE